MITRILLACTLIFSFSGLAHAQDFVKPDDSISFDLSTEDWVTTKTAHVTLAVEAAASATNEGSLRADMMKSVNDAARADWKETSFTRTQDQTGLERWSVTFDTRLPEASLNGLADTVKKASKAGMQISVSNIDFTPTLDETEAVRASLRAHILKEASDQLDSLNGTLPGRAYRIAQITFDSTSVAPMSRRIMRPMMAMANAAPAPAELAEQHAEKMILYAHITYAALPPVPTNSPAH